MSKALITLREHLQFIVVVTLLTLVMTFPTIVYVIRADVAWLPTGKSTDVFIKLWDIWYTKQILTGQASRVHTDLMFYPDGVSLVYHPIFIPHAILANALNTLMPLTNAFNLVHLLIIWSSALAAYVYLLWLFKDKWIALLGAVIFALCPYVVGNANHTEASFLTTIPLVLYGFHRGLQENRRLFIAAAGLLMGLTSISSLYAYVCIAITLAFALAYFAATRWHDKRFWQCALLLLLTIAASSVWSLFPLMSNLQELDAALRWHGEMEIRNDLISYFVNHGNPLIGPLGDALLHTPENANISRTSYIGYLPMLLAGIGLLHAGTRRKTLPWLVLWLSFIVLRLGSVLQVNGIAFPQIVLPKYYLNKILPFVFAPFSEADIMFMGAVLPLAVMTCYGIVALRERFPGARQPWFVLFLIAIIALEFYSPPMERRINQQELEYANWLAAEEGSGEIRLINLPMGRSNSKRYNYFQVLTGYPHAEGAISRTPDRAYNYIRSNAMLAAWHNETALPCTGGTADRYRGALRKLAEDGFSHVVWHRHHGESAPREAIGEGFRHAAPAFRDDVVSIYRLSDLAESCTL